MGIGPGGGTYTTSSHSVASNEGIESEEEILHRLALESKEPAVKEALKDLFILVKLYHADDIAEEKEENERFRRGMKDRIAKIMTQSTRTDVVDVQKVIDDDNKKAAEAKWMLGAMKARKNANRS